MIKRKPNYKRPPRTNEPRSAEAAIKDALAYRGISEEVRAERIHTEWSDLVGAKISSRTRPFGVVGKLLVVEVASSAWLHELNLLRPQILAGLLQRIGEPRLFDDLKFKLAGQSGGRPPLRPRPPRPAPPPPRSPTPATGLHREEIVREVERVDDLELRELIARVRIANDK
jgi:hypothetical protein